MRIEDMGNLGNISNLGNIEFYLSEGICFLLLCICTIFDIRKKEIPIGIICVGMTTSFCLCLWRIGTGGLTALQTGISMLPGAFFLLVSRCTKEKVGYGDGIMLIIIGLLIGSYRCFMLLCIALLCVTVLALFLLMIRKVERNSRIPFVPFLAIGMGVIFWI